MSVSGEQIPLDREALQNDTCAPSDYMIAVGCGAVAGLVDIFFVGAPGQNALGAWTDTQVDGAVKKFASFSGWTPREGKEDSVAGAIGFLERKYRVNYDQRHTADVGGLFQMSAKNHHILSLAHSPDIVGLFFSILSQFTSTSTFVSGGQLITISTETFELQGHNFISRLFCGFSNWLGHIMSDIAGSSGSRGNAGRGAGVAIPFYEMLQFCAFGQFTIGKDRQTLAELSIRAFQEGYDARFGLALAIPVLLCELSIRLIWMIKRCFALKKPLEECIPDSFHGDLRVMLLFGHGTLCLMDGADAAVRSGGNWLLFFTRINLPAWFRFAVLVFREICIRCGIQNGVQDQIDAYRRIVLRLKQYMAELETIDLEAFQRETKRYNALMARLDSARDERALNVLLLRSMADLGISLP